MNHQAFRRTAVAALAVAVLLTVLFGVWERSDEPSEVVRSADTPTTESASAGNAAEPIFPGSGENTDASVTPNTVADLSSPWQPAAGGDAQTPRKVRADIPATLMSVDRSSLESLNAGDQTLLPMGSDEIVVFSIATRKHYDAYNVTSLKGSIRQNGTSLPVVITYGDDSTLATISTRAGTYELRGSESQAWLYRSRDLGLPGGPVVDYLIPDRGTPTAQVSEVSPEVPAGPR